jgi:hypothetical protein
MHCFFGRLFCMHFWSAALPRSSDFLGPICALPVLVIENVGPPYFFGSNSTTAYYPFQVPKYAIMQTVVQSRLKVSRIVLDPRSDSSLVGSGTSYLGYGTSRQEKSNFCLLHVFWLRKHTLDPAPLARIGIRHH